MHYLFISLLVGTFNSFGLDNISSSTLESEVEPLARKHIYEHDIS